MNRQLFCKSTKEIELLVGDIPQTPPCGFIIKVHFCGVCHSDADIYSEDSNSAFLPRILGHEIAGTIHEIGKQCKRADFHTGDQVVVFPFGGCRKCNPCKVGNQNCINNSGSEVHGYGFWKDGGFQEYMAIEDPWSVVHVPVDMRLDLAGIVTCGGITAYNAVDSCRESIGEAIRVDGSANILVNGVGGLGLWAVDIVRAIYGDKVNICAADIYEDKLEDAKTEGANLTVCLPQTGDAKDMALQIINTFDGKKADAAIDFVNNSNTLERIYHSLNPGATLAMVGIEPSKFPPLDMCAFTAKNIRLQGVYAGRKMLIGKLFQLIVQGKVKGPEIHHIKLEEVKDVCEKMSHQVLYRGRAVVKF